MKSIAALSLAILLAAPALAAPPQPLDAVIDAAATKGFSGVVISGDRTDQTYARAVASGPSGPASTDALWRWASVTKQVTAMLVMQQVEAGRIDLDASVLTYLPQFKGPSAKDVSIRRLLQHTSGLPNPDDTPTGSDDMPDFYQSAAAANANLSAATGFCATAPKTQPGETFAYNNCDYLVLGAVLEAVTAKSYASLVSERIVEPLGLSTLAQFPEMSDAAPQTVSAAAEPTLNIATFGAAGALYGSPSDLLKLDQALMSGRLLSNASTDTMWTGDPALGYAALGAWAFPAGLPGCSGDVRLIERRGQIGGVQVRNIIAPDIGRALVVFANAPVEFGEIWQGQGLTFDLVTAAFCKTPA
jgi:CubicO group peptidase (beta-lactamase class C family)